jgi:NADPH2:quinone reductase
VLAYVGSGGCQERIVVPATRLLRVPENVSDPAAAGLIVTYGTAMHGLVDRAGLKTGETLAVLGASGGAGLAAVEIGALLGARVMAVASSAKKLVACREHGAHETVDYTGEDLKERLKALTNGTGVDVVYDCVGGDHCEPALRSMAWRGRYLVVGFTAGIAKPPLNLVLLKGCSVVGVFWGEAMRRDPDGQRRHIESVLAHVAAGRLRPHIHAVLPLERTAQALASLERREVVGKIVITPKASVA